MWRHYVYIHRRRDTGKIFYVGKGSHKKNDKVQNFSRASIIESRNAHWKNIVNKTEFTVAILCSCQTDLEAQRIEKEIIAIIGRSNLSNMTDGGDGSAGIIISEETRKKRSIASSGPKSEAWINAIRVSRKNGGNGGVVKKGDKLSNSWRANLSVSKIGNKNPQFGKHTALSKLVLNLENGIFYDTVLQAAIAHNINVKTLYQYLNGTRINKTALSLVDIVPFDIDVSLMIEL